MADLMISQTEPVSSLPRDYSRFLKRVETQKEPIIFLRRNEPVGALVGWNWLKELLVIKRKLEEQEALASITQSEKEFRAGKAKVLKSLTSLKSED